MINKFSYWSGSVTVGHTHTASVTGTFSSLDWSSGNVTITAIINGVSGNAINLRSVPYALFANEVKNYPTSVMPVKMVMY